MSPIPRSLLAIAISVTAGLAACATPAAPPPPTWQQKLATAGWTVGPEVDTVPNFSFDGYDSLDATHIVVHASVTRRVLVTTSPSCIDLASALRIGYEGSGHSLSRLDRLLVKAPGQLPSRCIVESIHLLQSAPAKDG